MKSTKTKKDISYGEIDDLSEEDFNDENVKMRISIYFDRDIVMHFKNEAKRTGEKYQTLMNRTLREHLGKKNAIEERLERIEREVFKK